MTFFDESIQIVAANLWNLNPRQLKAMRQCLEYEPDIVVLPELHNKCISDAKKLFLTHRYTLIHVRIHRMMSLGIASRIPWSHSTIMDQEAFAGRPQLKLHLENDITFLGIHLDAPVSPHRYRKRRQQLSLLADCINQSQNPVVLAGDFNTYFSESIFQTFLTQIDSRQCYSSVQRPCTWPSFLPLFQIDHILCSQQLKVTQLQQGYFNGSDHLPIYGCIDLR
ncbi:MAG: endonuclease/exonuclease/phosphatase family protein [Spirulina sp. SIO3F2]|nr:endonuclease/exonuclease/phosphatase family protein [Spirulina sp. SIO3F2]